jgi:RNA polymerase sigma-70 factor (ECF subfamily)
VDKDTLSLLMENHQANIYRYLKFMGADSSTAEDLLQEVFIAAYKGELPSCEMNDARVRGWLRGIARNLFYSYCRKNKRYREALGNGYLENAERYWQESNLDNSFGKYAESLKQCLQQVNDRNRKILLRRYNDNISRAELATEFRISDEGIKTTIRRTKEFLFNCIKSRSRETAK